MLLRVSHLVEDSTKTEGISFGRSRSETLLSENMATL